MSSMPSLDMWSWKWRGQEALLNKSTTELEMKQEEVAWDQLEPSHEQCVTDHLDFVSAN